MNRILLWKLCLIIGLGTITLFYLINVVTSRAEEGMSLIAKEHRQQIKAWGRKAEQMYLAGEEDKLRLWLEKLRTEQQTWVGVVESDVRGVAGSQLNERFHQGFSIGRSVDWKIHLYFPDNPLMEVTFADRRTHFLILLPDHMRPGIYWGYTSVALQIVLPMILLTLLSIVLYRHIMQPLRELDNATQKFSQGNLDVRVRQLLGNRNDELSELAGTFDKMAARIGELIVSQRQLITDLSHELRTPLTRLDIAVESLYQNSSAANIERIQRESLHIRRLVEDTLALAWLENERPELQCETLDLVDLLDVICDDAQFEFQDRQLKRNLPDSAEIGSSNHRALGQALENIIRNALRYTPPGGQASVALDRQEGLYQIQIKDQGPGVPDKYLRRIFEPFFRVDQSRGDSGRADIPSGFGLGLALAKRQVEAVGGSISANNLQLGGLQMTVTLPG